MYVCLSMGEMHTFTVCGKLFTCFLFSLETGDVSVINLLTETSVLWCGMNLL